MRPTLVGRVVTQSLEHNADTITKPGMTQTIEEHMQQIKESKRTRDDVIAESRGMLHAAFEQLEANEKVIGDDIRERTAEEPISAGAGLRGNACDQAPAGFDPVYRLFPVS